MGKEADGPALPLTPLLSLLTFKPTSPFLQPLLTQPDSWFSLISSYLRKERLNPFHRLGKRKKRFESSVKPQLPAAQALVADSGIPRGPSKVSWAECSPWGKESPSGALQAQHVRGTSQDVQGAVPKSCEKNGVEVGQAPTSMLRF